MTYFFSGHRNKVNLQLSQLTLTPDNATAFRHRLWVQWDLSF